MGAGVRDAFPPPMCVVGLEAVFSAGFTSAFAGEKQGFVWPNNHFLLILWLSQK